MPNSANQGVKRNIDPINHAVQIQELIDVAWNQLRSEVYKENSAGIITQALALLEAVCKGVEIHEGPCRTRDASFAGLKAFLEQRLDDNSGSISLLKLKKCLNGIRAWYKENHQNKAEKLGSLFSIAMSYNKDLEEELRREAIPRNCLTRRMLVYFYHQTGKYQNINKALLYEQELAEQGDVEAQKNLSQMYYYGDSVEQDFNKAQKWYRKAADQGHDLSQYTLGMMHYNGEAGKQDRKQALKWFRKAADQGLPYGQNSIVWM